jgi:HIT domain
MPRPGSQTADCIFCAIIGGDAQGTFVHQDELVVAFVDIRPVQPGHVLVVPRAHDGFGFRFPPGYDTEPGRAELEEKAGQIRPGLAPLNAAEASDR